MVIGMGTPVQTLPISLAAHREVDLVGVFRYTNIDYLASIEFAATCGNLDSIITHTFHGLGSVKIALETAASSVDAAGNLVIKVIIQPGNEGKGRDVGNE
jgi:L-iditol 2-dehydrogenase